MLRKRTGQKVSTCGMDEWNRGQSIQSKQGSQLIPLIPLLLPFPIVGPVFTLASIISCNNTGCNASSNPTFCLKDQLWQQLTDERFWQKIKQHLWFMLFLSNCYWSLNVKFFLYPLSLLSLLSLISFLSGSSNSVYSNVHRTQVPRSDHCLCLSVIHWLML